MMVKGAFFEEIPKPRSLPKAYKDYELSKGIVSVDPALIKTGSTEAIEGTKEVKTGHKTEDLTKDLYILNYTKQDVLDEIETLKQDQDYQLLMRLTRATWVSERIEALRKLLA